MHPEAFQTDRGTKHRTAATSKERGLPPWGRVLHLVNLVAHVLIPASLIRPEDLACISHNHCTRHFRSTLNKAKRPGRHVRVPRRRSGPHQYCRDVTQLHVALTRALPASLLRSASLRACTPRSTTWGTGPSPFTVASPALSAPSTLAAEPMSRQVLQHGTEDTLPRVPWLKDQRRSMFGRHPE